MWWFFTTHFAKYAVRFTTSHSLLSMAHGPNRQSVAVLHSTSFESSFEPEKPKHGDRKGTISLQLTCYFSKAILYSCKATLNLTASVVYQVEKHDVYQLMKQPSCYHSLHITNAALLWINWYYNLQDVLPRQVRSRAVWAQDHKLYLLKYSLHTNY